MRYLILTLAVLTLGSQSASAEIYRFTVTRIDRNLYRADVSRVLIETRLCLELALRDEVVLKWEGRLGDNWIIFSNDQKCDVIAIR